MSVPAQNDLRGVLSAGRAAYPDVCAEDGTIAAHLPDRARDPRCPADVFLAAAALAGDRAALDHVERLLADVAAALRGVVLDHEIDELVQEHRAGLVIPRGARPPALATYAGQGPLRAWLRVGLLRAGLDARRRPRPVPLDEAAWLGLPAEGEDPALADLRRLARPHLRSAFERALAELAARDRLLLRQHLVDGVAAPELARLHGVHRVTAFRWLAAIKQQVLANVRVVLARELGLSAASLDSLMQRVRESVVPTVERLLIAGSDPS